MTRLTEDERNVELFAKRKKVIDVVADLVILKYEAAGESKEVSIVGREDSEKKRDKPVLHSLRQLLVVLLEPSNSCFLVAIDSTTVNDHNAVLPESHPLHHLVMVLEVSVRVLDDLTTRAAELSELQRIGTKGRQLKPRREGEEVGRRT
jgi:hypothetical protein